MARDEPQGTPEGMVGSVHAARLIQPIWFCNDSISEEESEYSHILNFQVWEH